MTDLRIEMANCLKGRVCFLGLGNTAWGDDAFGVRLAEELAAAGCRDALIAGTQPERWIARLLDSGAEHVVFLDAVELGAEPGAVVFLGANEMAGRFPQISTHKLSLGLLARLVEASGTARGWLLGAQPASLAPSSKLTPAVQATLDCLVRLIREVIGTQEADATKPALALTP